MNINEALKEYTLDSKFDYEANQLESKVISIFDKEFKSINCSLVNEQCWVVLDKTCIYALSGGEEPDKGYIELNGNKINILDCIKAPNGQHLHLIKTDKELKVNDNVKVVCDELSKQTISCNHTAEHLLQGTLQKKLSLDLIQKGVNLTHDCLSVSFEWNQKLDDKQLKDIEDYINDAIAKAIPVEVSYKTLEEARASGVRAKFDNVYSKIKGLLRIVKIDDIYNVLCAGRHAHNTKELEQFHILKISSKGSNVWKIDAIATNYLTNIYINKFNKEIENKINDIKNQIQINKFDDSNFIKQLDNVELSNEWDKTISNLNLINKLSNEFNKLLEVFKNKLLNETVKKIVEETIIDTTKPYHLIHLENQPTNILNTLGSNLIKKYTNTGFIIINCLNDKISYAIIKNANANILKPNELIKQLNQLVNGRGGGKENQCQGSCSNQPDTINKIKCLIQTIK